MTQRKTEPAADTEDRLRDLYREHARETVPEHLNREILAQAAQPVTRNAGSRFAGWRPLALAATLALCVALVLEFDRQPPIAEPELRSAAEMKTPRELSRKALAAEAERLGAEKMARSGNAAANGGLSAKSGSGVADNVASATADHCDDEVRRNPVRWQECIAELEQRGAIEAASEQRRALQETYPEFKLAPRAE